MSAEDQSGMGVPPMYAPHGQDAHATVKKRQGSYLPHWRMDGAYYSVTFRLGDSLPAKVLEAWLFERRNIILTARLIGRPLSEQEERRLHELHSERVESYLDAAHGECWMRQPAIAKIVADALMFFDEQRYQLHAWCVMPNHVHVVLNLLPGNTLEGVLHSWKSFTSKACNKVLGRTGQFWQEEYYDHIIRGEADYNHAIRYVVENPLKAGLKIWPWVWPEEASV